MQSGNELTAAQNVAVGLLASNRVEVSGRGKKKRRMDAAND